MNIPLVKHLYRFLKINEDSTQLTRVKTLVIAGIIVSVVFPDIIFFGASFRTSQAGYLDVRMTHNSDAPSSLFPERAGRATYHGFVDLGGPVWNLEPAQDLMRDVIYKLESPFWTPYAGTGTIGVETLADLKFSIFTILNALLGAGNLSFHFVWISFFVFSLYSLIRTLTVYFHISLLASISACFTYLLSGFLLSSLHSALTPSYILGPIVLHSLVFLIKNQIFRV